jgi:hypothetical protein
VFVAVRLLKAWFLAGLTITMQEYLRCAQVVGLQKVAEGGGNQLVRKFAELVDGGVYTHAPCSKEAFARLLGEARHLQQAREDEFGRAMLQHLQEAEPEEVRFTTVR